jgi:hypothetical protein
VHLVQFGTGAHYLSGNNPQDGAFSAGQDDDGERE